jgi:hypothetical protein
MLLPMDPLTRMVAHLGLGPMVTVGGIVTRPRMVMQAQAQTPAVGVRLTDCRPLHHHPLQLLSIRMGLVANFMHYVEWVLLLLRLSFSQAQVMFQWLRRSPIGL